MVWPTEALRGHGRANVKIEVIRNSVHHVADEQPEAVAQLIPIEVFIVAVSRWSDGTPAPVM